MTHEPPSPADDQDASDQGSHLPAQKAMKQFSKQSASIDQGDVAPEARREQEARNRQRLSEGDKPVGESDNDGSSPYEEPHHRVKNQRDR